MSRTLGTYGMSVGTSMAFEGDGLTHLSHRNNLLINLRTIVRNVIEAYPSGNTPDVKTVANDVTEDLTKIAELIEANRGSNPILMKVYYPSYNSLPSKYRSALIKELKTDKQKAKAKLTEDSIKLLLKTKESIITKTDLKLPEFNGTALIVTHHVVDLAETRSYQRLELLESHTGAVKNYTQWYSKLTGGKDLYFMPFNRLTLQMFGDRGVQFSSHKAKAKEVLIKIAKDFNWNPSTSFSRVKRNIGSLPPSVDREALKLMF